MINRRRFISASASALAVLGAGAHPTLAQGADNPRIGDPREAFDAWFGPGTEVGPYIQYPPLSEGRARYSVAFDQDGRSTSILGDFQGLAGGGIVFDESDAGQSQYLHDDAVADQYYKAGYHKDSGGNFRIQSWHSPGLAADTGKSGRSIVMDRVDIMSFMDFDVRFIETLVGLDVEQVNPIVPTGEEPGPHTSHQDWVAYNNGYSLMSEAGLSIQNPPLPGYWVVLDGNGGELSVTLDSPVTAQEAASLIGSRLPAAELVSSMWCYTSPTYGQGVRLHEFSALDTGARYLSVQFVDGDEDTGTVSRFNLVPAMAG